MITLKKEVGSNTLWHQMTCDGCGAEIESWEQVRLLRNVELVPENMSVCFVHTACVDAFEQQHDGTWKRYDPSSPSARWFIPALIRPPVEHEHRHVAVA